MDKEIKIIPPKGYEIDKEKSTFDLIQFKKVGKENPTWEEIQLNNLGKTQYCLSSFGEITRYTRSFDKSTRTHLPSNRIAEKVRALCQLYIIAEYYNDGWEGGYTNDVQSKYFPTWDNEENKMDYLHGKWTSLSTPTFKSIEILMEAYEANKEIFEMALKP